MPAGIARFLVVSAAAIASLGAIVGFSFTPIGTSQDEWWHLKTGKVIWENGLWPPRNDVLALASADYRWDNHEWLSETAMYGVYRLGGSLGFGPMRAVIAAKTVILLMTFALVAYACYKRSGRLVLAILLALLAAAVSRRTIQPRPPVVSYFFIAFFHLTLVAYRAGRIPPRLLFALPILMVAWANLHGGFILGGIAIACFFIGELAEGIWACLLMREPDRARGRRALGRAGTLLSVGALCGAASLVNPFGWRLYLLPYRVMSEPFLVSLIWELQPPDFRYTQSYFALFLLLMTLGMLAPRRVIAGEALWVCFLFQQSFNHVRHLPLFAIAAAPVAADLAGAIWNGLDLRRWACRATKAGISALVCALGLWWLLNHSEGPSYGDRALRLLKGKAYSIDDYPVRLADFIEDADFHGRMFNDSRYAGYLIWRFSPEKHKVFTDMRYDIFGGDFVADDMAARRGVYDEANRPAELDWRTVFKKWNFNFAILDHLEGLNCARPVIGEMDKSGEWTRVYQDPKVGLDGSGLVVYLKNGPENADLLARCRRLAPEGLYMRPGREMWGR